MSAPRHRLDPPQVTHRARELPVVNYQPDIPLRSSDFDAVAPRRPLPQAPVQRSTDDWADDQIHLAHS